MDSCRFSGPLRRSSWNRLIYHNMAKSESLGPRMWPKNDGPQFLLRILRNRETVQSPWNDVPWTWLITRRSVSYSCNPEWLLEAQKRRIKGQHSVEIVDVHAVAARSFSKRLRRASAGVAMWKDGIKIHINVALYKAFLRILLNDRRVMAR